MNIKWLRNMLEDLPDDLEIVMMQCGNDGDRDYVAIGHAEHLLRLVKAEWGDSRMVVDDERAFDCLPDECLLLANKKPQYARTDKTDGDQ